MAITISIAGLEYTPMLVFLIPKPPVPAVPKA